MQPEPIIYPPSDARTEEIGDILVVDDHPGNLLAIELALGSLGGSLVKARSGEEALRYLLQQDFALVLLDVQMPAMDGFETARLIRSRKRTEHLPIIFVTAFSHDDGDILTGYGLGAVDFLFKPILPEVLRAKASVFVQLQRHTREVARQAELLREHERREHERELREEKQKWEAEALRRQMDEQRKVAEELARTVAERERAQRELTRINHRLEQADRRKDEFLAMLAHELRNPLAPILTSLELIRDHDVDSEIIARARDAMARQVHHLVRLVDDLLDVSRITSGKIELRTCRVELQAAVRQAENMVRPLIEEREHVLELSYGDERIWLMADPVRLTQIIANLLSNAARHTPPRGHIQVRCEVQGDEVVMQVSDNGPGIPLDMVDKVFDMFVQVGRPADGLGLGLALVHRLVALHGGQVGARSSGAGSEFTVRLPAWLETSSHAQEAAESGVEAAAGTCVEVLDAEVEQAPGRPCDAREPQLPLRVVVIDDEVDIRETMRDLLSLWGHHVEVAADGYEGVDLLLRVRPDVALVDIGLPGIDGYGVAQRVAAVLAQGRPRLVAMSGYGQEKDRRRALADGFDEHVTKPATADILRRVLSGA